MPEKPQPRGGNAAGERPLVYFASRHDDRVGVGHQPGFVHLSEIGDHRHDRDVLHVRVGARSQRRVVEQRVDGDDDVGLIADEQVAQPLAVERFAEADERLVAPPAVRRVVQRAVNGGSVPKGHAIAEPELRQREGAVSGDIFDAVFEPVGRVDLV